MEKPFSKILENFISSGDVRLDAVLKFAVEADQMTAILRRNLLTDASRRENDAEHSWHIALMAMLFKDYAEQTPNVERAVKMCVVHDLGVVYPEVGKYVSPEAFIVKVLDHHVEAAKHNLKGAPIVVAGGYGVGSKEGFDQLFTLAKVLHGEVGGSRAAVDAGWIDHDRQIGQTGVTVHPKVYIACGISGQIQHIAGMQDSGIIISVNSDPDAPINKIADYVIVGTVEEVVPKLIKYYKQNSK